MYHHECEPVRPILIVLPMMQYGVLCLVGEVGSNGLVLNIILLWGGGRTGFVCCQVSFCLGLGR